MIHKIVGGFGYVQFDASCIKIKIERFIAQEIGLTLKLSVYLHCH